MLQSQQAPVYPEDAMLFLSCKRHALVHLHEKPTCFSPTLLPGELVPSFKTQMSPPPESLSWWLGLQVAVVYSSRPAILHH